MNLRRCLFFVFVWMIAMVGQGKWVQAAPFGYISDTWNDWIFVLDLGTETAKVVDVGNSPAGVAVSPDGSRVYVANYGDPDSISVINTADNTLHGTYPVGGNDPLDVAVSPDSAYIYTAYTSDYLFSSSVVKMDASTGEVKNEVELVGNAAAMLSQVVASPDGDQIYVADKTNGVIYVVRESDFSLRGPVPVGAKPRGLAVSPDSSLVYVANEGDGTVTIIDVATLSVKRTVSLPEGDFPSTPWSIAVSPGGHWVYVTDSDNNRVIILSGAGDFERTVPVGNDPRGLDINSDGTRVFVTNFGADTLSVINTSTYYVDTVDLYQGVNGGLGWIDLSPYNNSPTAPKLTSPANGATGISTSPELRWENSFDPNYDPLTYKIYCSTNRDFTNTTPVTVTSLFSQHQVLLAGGGFFSLLLLGIPGAIHSRRKLLALLVVCAAATLLATACGGGGGDGTAPSSNTPDGSDPQDGQTVTDLSPGTTYYWKVVADDGNGGITESETWSFTTAN